MNVEYAKPVNMRLNPSGRTVRMSVPLKDGERSLGEVAVAIAADDKIAVSAAQLKDRLAGVIDNSVLAGMLAGTDNNGELALEVLQSRKLRLTFDPGRLELVLKQGADLRGTGDISLDRSSSSAKAADAPTPAAISGYVNILSGVDHTWADQQPGRTAAHVELQSALRLRGTVIENDAYLDGNVDTFTCPVEARCTYDHKAGLKRRSTRIVHDLPEQNTRIQLGDVRYSGIGQQRTPDVLGAAIEHSQRRVGTRDTMMPSGQSSFRLERAADVEVIVNGASIRRFRLGPGTYNLRDLPLGSGANDVEIIITSESGERRKLAFKTFIDQQMLRPGATEWSASGGVPSVYVDGGRDYRFGDRFASAYLRHGLTSGLTGEVHGQADERVQMGGLGTIWATPLGAFKAESAVSLSSRGTGFAMGLDWTLAGFKGTLDDHAGARQSLRLSAQYRSTAFRSPGDTLVAASGILYPQYPYWLRLQADYSTPIGRTTMATLSARYQFTDPQQFAISPLAFAGDRYAIDLTVSRPLTQLLNAAVTLGYGNEAQLRDISQQGSGEADLRAMIRLYWRSSDSSSITADYDTANRYSRVSAWRGEGQGVGRWEANVDAQNAGYADSSSSNAGITYYANRAEVRASQSSSYAGAPWDGLGAVPGGQRTSLQVGTGIAFADGHVAIGRPVRGDGFAIVYPHESLEGRTVEVGTSEAVTASTGTLGPALVSNLPSYTNYGIPYDVPDLPIGYSLGAGAFNLWTPYKAGYALQVGSDHAVSVFGTLLLADGAPAALVTGEAKPETESAADKAGRVQFFTNSAGKFGAEGLAPGTWTLSLASDTGPLTYRIMIPKDTKGLYRAGTLRPVAQ